MDKNTIFSITVVVLVIILGFVFLGENSPLNTKSTISSYEFTCNRGEVFTVKYSGSNNNTANLTLNEQDYSLEKVVSDSGTRYANEDESFVFWEQQGEALIMIEGDVVYDGCVSEPIYEETESDNAVSITSNEWRWQETNYLDSDPIRPFTPSFIVTFNDDESFSSTTDCNTVTGTYTAEESSISLGSLSSTEMFCEDNNGFEILEEEYTSMMSKAFNYYISSGGILRIDLQEDNNPTGSMVFTPIEEQ
ncbi:MAG: META domain-containing protein, partial [Candidatus Paceibacterota bacterium]